MFTKTITLAAFAASAAAHMKMLDPVPFGNATLNNSPLEVGDFPCKQRAGVYDITEMNQWDAGQTKTISFLGSAVHGGGSCQFSITTDQKPSMSSQWKVIQSVVGGCPANVPGNLPGGPETTGAGTFPVTMPKNIPDGQYTFAWTWLNKVGNREFYMNCAPIKVGGSGKASTESVSAALGSLPDMFVANLPATECSTTATQDFNYPDPGQNVIKGAGAAVGNTLTGAGCAKQNKIGAGNGSMGSPAPGSPSDSTPSKPSSPASPPKGSDKPAPSKAPAANPGGVFAPGASPVAPAPEAPAAPAPQAPAAPAPKPSTPETPNTTTPSNGDCTPCTNDGAIVCIGSKQFGLCNRGCAVAQDLAAGMTCANGAVVASTKRSLNFPRAHLHRRHSGARL